MKWLSILWRGLVIGVADVIPGVSGGTIALLVGVYERFINALKQLTALPRYAYEFLRGKMTLQELREDLDVRFIVPLVIGMAVAIVLASAYVPLVMDRYPAPTFSFFIALILAASFGLLRAEIQNKKSILALAAGLLFGVGLGLLAPSDIGHSLPFLFVSGILAISAMLVPGISGSAILLIIGQYSYVLEQLHQPFTLPILSFGAGVLVGMAVTVRIISRFLQYSRELTISVLTGIMIGALLLPIRSALPHLPEQEIASAVAAIIGLGLGTLLLLSHNGPQYEQ